MRRQNQLPDPLRSHSIAHGSPPHFPHRKDAFEQAQWLLTLPDSLPNDNRLVATYEYEEIARECRARLINRPIEIRSDLIRSGPVRRERIR